jgi:hypothetical protein
VATVANLGWDQEAQQQAQQHARACHRRDPDAAGLLLAQLEAEQCAAAARPVTPRDVVVAASPPGEVYDPLDLYCRLARELHWPDTAMDDMDYVRFFGYVDRLSRQHQQEEQERKNQGSGQRDAAIVDAENHALIAGLAPTPVPYQGETVAYRG